MVISTQNLSVSDPRLLLIIAVCNLDCNVTLSRSVFRLSNFILSEIVLIVKYKHDCIVIYVNFVTSSLVVGSLPVI